VLHDRARELGLDLDTLAATSERELYDRLGLPPLPAEVRTGDGEVAAALAGDDFEDLVSLEDVRGAVHCHTLYSDGKLSISGMAAAAIERGLDYLTITDHSPSAHYAGGLDVERLIAQREEIAQVQLEYGDRLAILAGTESDILPDGSLDFPDAVLAELDLVIASVHGRNGQDEDAMTARLLACMRHPIRKIWGHPLGRLLLRRDPIACRLDEVLDAVAATGTVIEVNGDPYRLDMPPEHLRAARRRGISFVISTDAHSGRGLDALRYGVAMARRGWLRKHEVVNTGTADAFRAAVRPSGAADEHARRRSRGGLGNQRHQA
jgi:DNA polymerase (family 10)